MCCFLLFMVVLCMRSVDSNQNTSCTGPSWGSQCEKPCEENCLHCERANGTCLTCAAGWLLSNFRSCHTQCLPMTYGQECKGSCQDKCNRDCADRVTGACFHVLGSTGTLSLAFLWDRLRTCFKVKFKWNCVWTILSLVTCLTIAISTCAFCCWRAKDVIEVIQEARQPAVSLATSSLPSVSLVRPSEVSALSEILSSESGSFRLDGGLRRSWAQPPVFLPWVPARDHAYNTETELSHSVRPEVNVPQVFTRASHAE